jgi:hypothetical protein
MSKQSKTIKTEFRTTASGRRACQLCDLPAVEALLLDETTAFPIPLCRNHARRGRKYEAELKRRKREERNADIRNHVSEVGLL